ncbi:MAG: hypothetical protein N7Q72_04100 [Spiroplasma sp. Tabriz.8]|nr:hypothetical protein [Spiroplasma sp. Tabriz.8]
MSNSFNVNIYIYIYIYIYILNMENCRLDVYKILLIQLLYV